VSWPLCHRCEYRARVREGGEPPRYECGTAGAVVGCYMYRAVVPVLEKRQKGDRRPVGAPWMLSARTVGVGLAPGGWVLRKTKGGHAVYYEGGKDCQQ
jgi:hypothetical protein